MENNNNLSGYVRRTVFSILYDRHNKKYISYKSPSSIFLVLILNGLLYTYAHMQYYKLTHRMIIFTLGIINGIIYLSLGITPSIITHALWNFYFNGVILFPMLITAFAVIIFSLGKKNVKNNFRDK